MTVIVKKLGGSVAVVIPKAVANEMRLTEGTALDVSSTATEIVMRKQARRPRRALKQLVAGMNPAAYRRHNRAMLGGSPVGREVW
jgi:antitoxin component of MazEF toxin-antitoxin module